MKTSRFIVIFVMLLIGVILSAENWQYEADVSFSMNQNSYSENWAGGEKGSISWTSSANLLAEKSLSLKLHNKNTLKLAFGQTHNQYIDPESGDKKWQHPDKTTDLIDLESVLRFTLGSFVDPYISGRLETQFLDQTTSEETKSFNPLILTESFGVIKMFIKEDNRELSSRLGGAFKQYLNRYDDLDDTNDGGIEFVTEYKTPLAQERITFNSKLNVYKALYYSESDALEGSDFEDDWKAPRVNWENIFSASITKLINLNLYLDLIYDQTNYDVEGKSIDEIQFKQTLALGITYKLL